MMQKHKKETLEQVDCPFSISFKDVIWDEVVDVLSLDDTERTVIVQTHDCKYVVNIPFVLYDSIFKSGELNVIESDLGFDENY